MKSGGGSMILWGCVLWDGPKYASRIDGSFIVIYFVILEWHGIYVCAGAYGTCTRPHGM